MSSKAYTTLFQKFSHDGFQGSFMLCSWSMAREFVFIFILQVILIISSNLNLVSLYLFSQNCRLLKICPQDSVLFPSNSTSSTSTLNHSAGFNFKSCWQFIVYIMFLLRCHWRKSDYWNNCKIFMNKMFLYRRLISR